MDEPTALAGVPALTVAIANEQPLNAGDVAAMLDALDGDYRRFSGRPLKVKSLHTGTLTAVLVDGGMIALAAMGGAVTINEFVKLVAAAIKKVKGNPRSLPNSRAVGAKTVRSFAHISRTSRASVRVSGPNLGGTISASITHEEVERIYVEIDRDAPSAATPNPSAQERIAQTDRDLERFAVAAAALSSEPDGNPALYLARVIVKELQAQPGGAKRLARIAENLRSRGQLDAANLLERLLAA